MIQKAAGFFLLLLHVIATILEPSNCPWCWLYPCAEPLLPWPWKQKRTEVFCYSSFLKISLHWLDHLVAESTAYEKQTSFYSSGHGCCKRYIKMPFKKCMLQAPHHSIPQGINAAAVGQELSHTVSRCHPDLMGSTYFCLYETTFLKLLDTCVESQSFYVYPQCFKQ